METLFQYKIPAIHPLIVHFPPALILVAGLAMIVWSIQGKAFWRRCALLLLSLGMATGLVAYQTGKALEEQVEGTPIVEELVRLHEDLAFYALIVTTVVLVPLAGMSVWLERRTTLERNPPDPLVPRIALTIIAVAAAVLIYLTAHVGGTMVWGVPV